MIYENKNCVTKSNLQQQQKHLPDITIGTGLRPTNKQRKLEKQKQTQRHRKCRTFKQKNKKTHLQINTQVDLQSTYAHREVNTNLKMSSYVLLLLN